MAIIKPNNNTISAITALPAGVGGKVLQVVNAESTTVDSFLNVGWTNTSLSANITPSSSSNKIYVLSTILCSHGNHGNLRITKDGTEISVGVSSSNRPAVAGYMGEGNSNTAKEMTLQSFHTAGGTSEITYRIQVRSNNSSDTSAYINRTVNDADANYGGRGISILTLMEIAG